MPRTSKIFRIFVSSTFADLKHERLILQRYVFPELQQFCEKFGAKLQPIDLRWGVSEEAQLDQKTLQICLNELQKCKELSPRPNFLLLLGNRYGWRPVPVEIKKDQFEHILAYYEATNKLGHSLLTKWYKEDCNSIPVTYCLQKREGKYIDQNEWYAIEESLRLLFDHVIAELSFQENELGSYMVSATEHEIRAGAFQQEGAHDHVFAFFRNIQRLPKDKRAKDFQDFTSEGKINEGARKQLDKLKSDIQAFLPEENIAYYEVGWKETDIDTSYLMEFRDDVLNKLKPIIEKECRDIEHMDVIAVEKEKHKQFGFEQSRNFIGRDDLFTKIEKVLKTTTSLLVICGESGSGKTAFAAELSKRIDQQLESAKLTQRFIGASAFGTNTLELLESILVELKPDESEIIIAQTEIDDLLQLLLDAFDEITKQKPIYIVIDGLDHLTDQYLLPKWFLTQLPEQVHLIVTVAKDCDAYSLLKRIIDQENMFEIGPLSVTEGRKLLEQWLAEWSRTLQANQYKEVIEKFKECPLPLFLKFAFEEAKLWKSYSENVKIEPSISGVINQFLGRISSDSNHGPVLVKNVFGFLAASKSGLEEAELLELLSQSEEVMGDFRSRAKHEYIENSLPPIIWARLFDDLIPYLVEKKENGTLVYSFYHRQLEKRVKEVYLMSDFHRSISNYYDKKPTFLDDNKTLPNIRKISELPFQLYQTRDIANYENILTDFDFLEAKFTAMFSQDLLHDYSLLKELITDEGLLKKRVNDFERFCRIRHDVLLQYPDRLKLFALRMPHATYVFKESEQWYIERETPYIRGGNSNLSKNRFLHIFDIQDDNGSICKLHPNGQHIIVASGELLKVWDIMTGEETFQHHPQIGKINNVSISDEALLASIVGEKGLKVIDLQSYDVFYQKQTQDELLLTDLHINGSCVAVSNADGNVLLINIEDNEELLIKKEDYDGVFTLKWHPTELVIAIWANDEKIYLMDFKEEMESKVLYSEYQLEKYILFPKFYNLSFDEETGLLYASQDYGVTVWDILLASRVNNTVKLPKGNHISNKNVIFSVQYDNQIKVWDVDGFHYLTIDHNYFQTYKYATVQKGILAVITLDGKVVIWDLTKLRKSYSESNVEMINDSFWWVLAPLISGIITNTIINLFEKTFKTFHRENVDIKKGTLNEKILNVSVSPNQSYISTGHLGNFLQIKNIKENSITQFKPHNTEPILYSNWSFDESLIYFGTTQRAWVMTLTGKLKQTIKTENKIVSGSWSPNKNQLLVLYTDGNVSIYDFNLDCTHHLKLEIEAFNKLLNSSWSNRGDHFVICYEQTYLLYEFIESPKLVVKRDNTKKIHKVVWSPDDQLLTFVDYHYETTLVSLNDGEVKSRFDIVSSKEMKKYSTYYNYLTTPINQRIAFLNSIVQGNNKGKYTVCYIRFLPFQLLVSWKDNMKKIAFAYGNWLTVFVLDNGNERIHCYIDDGIHHINWENNNLRVLTGNKLDEEVFVIVDEF